MSIICHFRDDVKLNKKNHFLQNPVIKGNIKRKKINGKFKSEEFYIIDFYGIKKDYYVISSFGRVFSLKANMEMKASTYSRSYPSITLQTEDGKHRTFLIHCLVARAFVPKSSSDKKLDRVFVHHVNWDNDYNYYWNLQWRSGYELSCMKKLTQKDEVDEDTIKVICGLLERGTPIVDIFEIVDRKVSKDRISKIKNKTIYKEISYDYTF